MVVLSEPLSETHHGLPPERQSPQAFWRFGSVVGATSGTFETSGVTVKLLPGGPACVGTAATRPATMTKARRAPRTENRVIVPPSLCALPRLAYGAGAGPVCAGRWFSGPSRAAKQSSMLFLLLLLAALIVLGIVLAVAVVKWLFILAVVAALCWVIVFFMRRTV